MLRISQIKRNAEKGEQGLKHAAAKELRIREEEIQNLRICKRSLDARKKPELYYVYTVDVEVNDEEKILRRCKSNKVTRAKEVIYAPEQSGTIPFTSSGCDRHGACGAFLCTFSCKNRFCTDSFRERHGCRPQTGDG